MVESCGQVRKRIHESSVMGKKGTGTFFPFTVRRPKLTILFFRKSSLSPFLRKDDESLLFWRLQSRVYTECNYQGRSDKERRGSGRMPHKIEI